MPRRPYSMERRDALEAKTRERIVRATVALHAEHGVSATSYAMIAKRAQVSPQTVYNHFPELRGLFGACTGHVLERAPPVGLETFQSGQSPAGRLRRLAVAVFTRHAFMEPWLRRGWHEAALIPELREALVEDRDAFRRLIAAAVAPEQEPIAGFVEMASVILGFPAWQELTRSRSSAEAARIAGDSLVDLLPRLTRPTPRKVKPKS